MKFYAGRWYLALRVGDACFGLGRAPEWMREEAVRTRRHFGV